jgi:AcrR family transcriptional regulator
MNKVASELKAEVAAYKRQRILEEASRLFFEKGYEGSTLDSLAERLQVTKPFLYSYYRNKGEILAAICETGIKESLRAVEEATSAGTNPVEQLRALVSKVARIVIQRQEYIVVYQRETKGLERADAQRILRMRHDFDNRVARVVAEGKAQGHFNVDDAALASVWIGGLLSWLANWYAGGGRRTIGEIVAQVEIACLRIVGIDGQ